jgi:type I restriction enzyme S subunit
MAMREVRVGDVLRSNRRWIKVHDSAEYVAIGVRAFGRGIFHYEPVPGSHLGRLRFYEVQPKSLIVSNIKAWEGAVDVCGPSEEGTIASNRFLSYEPIDSEADVNFLRHYFLTEFGNQKLQRASPGSADRNRTLAASRFEDILVPLPSLSEQQRTAARLDRIEAASASFGTPPTAILRDNLLDRISQKSQIGHITTLARSPVSVKADGVYPNVGVLNRARGVFAKPSMRGFETKYSTLYLVRTGQLIYSKLFGWEGSLAIVPEWADGWFVSSEFPTFDVNTDVIDLDYFGQVLRWRGLAEQLAAATSGMGQRRQRVQIDQFEALEVPLPDLPTQRRIGAELLRLAEVEELAARRATLSAALLPAARNKAFATLN